MVDRVGAAPTRRQGDQQLATELATQAARVETTLAVAGAVNLRLAGTVTIRALPLDQEVKA
jgi:hypothetical protein